MGLLSPSLTTGRGIPIEERENVLNLFYRLEQSRRTPGNGLGLSLVAAIARLHGAEIEMSDNAPGLKLKLRFPLLAIDRRMVSRQQV
jgi:signal transduction histidine kinase